MEDHQPLNEAAPPTPAPAPASAPEHVKKAQKRTPPTALSRTALRHAVILAGATSVADTALDIVEFIVYKEINKTLKDIGIIHSASKKRRMDARDLKDNGLVTSKKHRTTVRDLNVYLKYKNEVMYG